jgi:hypothetical protein
MRKPVDLRAFLTQALPEFQADPDKLEIFVGKGKLVSTGTLSLSHEYRYTLTVIAVDYASEPEALMVPLLVWLRRNQPDIFDNPVHRADAIRFEVDFNNHTTVDVEIEVDLTERVGVSVGEDRRVTVAYLPEPVSPDMPVEDGSMAVWFEDRQIAVLPIHKWDPVL